MKPRFIPVLPSSDLPMKMNILPLVACSAVFLAPWTALAAPGDLDTSFGIGGRVTTPIGGVGNSVAVQTDGEIVVAGFAYNGSNYDFALARYNPDGSLDTGFGSGGTVITPVGNRDDIGTSVALQADGKIVVAGYSGPFLETDFALVRYNANGSLDTSFNATGTVTTDFGGNGYEQANGVALQADGEIVVAGFSGIASYSGDFALARYEAGPLPPLASWRQTSFGTTLNFGNAADTATPDGDGIHNLIKYALVIASGTPGASALPQGQRRTCAEGQRLALVFTHDPARYDITLEVQTSDTPGGPWTTVAGSIGGATFSGAGFISETPAGSGLSTVEVRDIVNLADAPQRSIRIQVRH